MRRKPRPPADPHLARLLASRGRLHAHQYLQSRDSHNLGDAIATMRTAVGLAKETQSDVLGPALGNLAALLLEKAKSTGNDAVLSEALQLATWALDCLSNRDPDHVLVLATLGGIFASQYDRTGRFQALEEAISSLESATRAQTLTSLGDGTFPAVVSNNLACVLEKRYESTGRREDLNDAIASALKATEMESSNYPLMMAGMGSNLASLLARQYVSTGALENLANALFELRIVTEVAPECIGLDALLNQMATLAKGQHEMREQPMAEHRGVSQLTYSESLPLFVLLSLSPMLSVVYPGAIYPLAVFLGGIACNWAVQTYQGLSSSDGGPGQLLHSAPTWVKKKISAPYYPSRFSPILFSTPWIEAPSTSTWTKDELFAGERLWKQGSIPSAHFEAEPNQGDYRIPRASLSHPALVATASPKAQDHQPVTTRQRNQPYDHLGDSAVWDHANFSANDPADLGTPPPVFGDEGEISKPGKADDCVPAVAAKPTVTVEDLRDTDTTHFTEASGISEKKEIILDKIPISKEPAPDISARASEQEYRKLKSTRKALPHGQDQESISKQQDRPSPTSLNPVDGNIGSPKIPNTTLPPRQDGESTEDAHVALGKKIDQKVHSRRPPGMFNREPMAFETVAQGHTKNDINKNEGNAMGNIYSEEAHVVGHLSRHYGDRFETKNISAIMRGYQSPEANQNSRDGTSDVLRPDDIPQEVINEYIRGLNQQSEKEQPDKKPVSTSSEYMAQRVDRLKKRQQARDGHLGGRSLETQPEVPDGDSSGFREDKGTSPTSSVDSDIFVKRRESPSSLRATNGFPASSPTRRDASRGVLPAPTESSVDSSISDAMPRVRRSATTGRRSGNYSESEGSESVSSVKIIPHRSRRHPSDVSISRQSVPQTKAPDSDGQDDYIPEDYSKQVSAQEYISRSRGFVPLSSKESIRGRSTRREIIGPEMVSISYSPSPSSKEPTRARRMRRRKRSPVRTSISWPRPPDLRRYRTPYEQLRALSAYYSDHLRPLCTEFVNNTPEDSRTRDIEYKRLSELILQQVLLNADGIDASGDEHTRSARRTLVEQAHATLNQLDEAVLRSK